MLGALACTVTAVDRITCNSRVGRGRLVVRIAVIDQAGAAIIRVAERTAVDCQNTVVLDYIICIFFCCIRSGKRTACYGHSTVIEQRCVAFLCIDDLTVFIAVFDF